MYSQSVRRKALDALMLTDITEFKLPSGEKAYLSPVIDCYDGLVVAWRIGRRPNASLANGSLEDACKTLAPGQHPVCHSDRGCHYRWPGWMFLIAFIFRKSRDKSFGFHDDCFAS